VAAEQVERGGPSGSLAALSFAALGVVFGDIGTSPLYTFKTVLAAHGSQPDPLAIIGSLSLIFWTLTVITTVKYVSFAMRIDNDGEGGILALMSLLGIKKQHRPAVVALGLFGAALIYGDGAITPAISVLSALEGIQIATPALGNYVLPCAVAILVALFAIQPLGTARIGRAFGPVMALWFVTIAVLGVVGIMKHPSVLVALDPTRGLRRKAAVHGLRDGLQRIERAGAEIAVDDAERRHCRRGRGAALGRQGFACLWRRRVVHHRGGAPGYMPMARR